MKVFLAGYCNNNLMHIYIPWGLRVVSNDIYICPLGLKRVDDLTSIWKFTKMDLYHDVAGKFFLKINSLSSNTYVLIIKVKCFRLFQSVKMWLIFPNILQFESIDFITESLDIIEVFVEIFTNQNIYILVLEQIFVYPRVAL